MKIEENQGKFWKFMEMQKNSSKSGNSPRWFNPASGSYHFPMQSDVGLHRKTVFSLEKSVGFGLDFVGIFAAGFRTGLCRKRSDRFSSNPTIRYCRNRPNLMLGNSRIMPDSTTDLVGFCRNLETTGIHRLSILKPKVYYANRLSLLLL